MQSSLPPYLSWQVAASHPRRPRRCRLPSHLLPLFPTQEGCPGFFLFTLLYFTYPARTRSTLIHQAYLLSLSCTSYLTIELLSARHRLSELLLSRRCSPTLNLGFFYYLSVPSDFELVFFFTTSLFCFLETGRRPLRGCHFSWPLRRDLRNGRRDVHRQQTQSSPPRRF